MRDHSVDVMLLCETWHDTDSVSIGRLRVDGFSVIERARPRVSEMSLSVNQTVPLPSSPQLALVCRSSTSVSSQRCSSASPLLSRPALRRRLSLSLLSIDPTRLPSELRSSRAWRCQHPAGACYMSGHCLLRWTSSLKRPAPMYTKSTRRLWRSFDLDVFQPEIVTTL